MEARFTLVGAQGAATDLMLRCEADRPASELVDALVEAGLAEAGQPVFCGTERVETPMLVGHPPLLDGCILAARPRPRTEEPSLVTLVVRGGPDAGRHHRLTWGATTVGRGEGVDLHVDDPHLSRHHVTLRLGGSGVSLEVVGQTNPVHVDGEPVTTTVPVTEAQLISLGHSTLALSSEPAGEMAMTRADGAGHLAVHRAPRNVERTPPRVVEIPRTPEPPTATGIPWAMLLIPLPVSALMAMFLGPTMLLFGLLGPVMALGNLLVERLGRTRAARRQRSDHARDVNAARRELAALLLTERRTRGLLHPDPMDILEAAAGRLTLLWSRTPGSADFLALRIGLGSVPSRHAVAEGSQRRHPELRLTPVVADLPGCGVLGVAGAADDLTRTLRALIGQVAVLHSPNDVRLVALTRPEDDHWAWLGWLPHTSATAADLPAELERRRAGATTTPALVVLAPDCERLRQDPWWGDLLTEGPGHGIHVIAAATSAEALPHECRAVLDLGDPSAHHLTAATASPTAVVADGVGPWWSERLARSLAPLRDATPGAARPIPTQCSLVDLLAEHGTPCAGPADVVGLWQAEGDPLPLGIGEHGPVSLDLRRHGPHALVAGTTGSGKSELLQAWALSMALAQPPSALNLFFADFKGGATFTELARLPHCVGLVTDLDGRTAQRALDSLQEEVRRREQVLAHAGARSLDALEMGDGPTRLPRLMVLVDEYRVLAEEHPEVLDGLVRIAAVGRSLGIHLVLATQRPAGIVSADIAANTSLRVALRTQDAGDSQHVLDAPDAAHIPASLPGRAVFRGDGDGVQAFQTARVGGRLTTGRQRVEVWPLHASAPDQPTDGASELVELVSWIRNAAAATGEADAPALWHPPLPVAVPTTDLPAAGNESVAWGLVDEPALRRWAPLSWERSGGHVALIGSDRVTRDEAALALVEQVLARWMPHEVHVHLLTTLEVPEAIRQAPHIGSVVDPRDAWTAKRLLSRLTDESRARTRGGPSPLADRPTVLLVVDVEALAAGPDEAARDLLTTVLRDGPSVGVRVLLCGGRSLLLGRLSSAVSERYVLPMADPSDLTLAGVARSALDGAPRGRAVRVADGAVVQFAQAAGRSPRTGSGAEGERPWRVSPLPHGITLDEVAAPARHGRCGWVIGVGGDDGGPVGIDPEDLGRRLVITGPGGSGRSTALRTLAHSAGAAGASVVLVGPEASRAASRRAGTHREVPTFGATDADGLSAHLADHPDALVLVDDAERLPGTPVDDLLCAHEALLDEHGGMLVVSVSATALATSFRGLAVRVARAQSGVLLCPTSPVDAEPFGLRVDPVERLPGRGYLIARGRALGLQVATPEPARPRRSPVAR